MDLLNEVLTLDVAVQFAACSLTLAAMWLMGNKNLYGPVLALVGESVWLYVIIEGRLWGILPFTFACMWTHGRNWIKWRRERDNVSADGV